jgi:hypothetical protein
VIHTVVDIVAVFHFDLEVEKENLISVINEAVHHGLEIF